METPKRTETMVALRATKQAVNVAWDVSSQEKLEPYTVPAEWIRLRQHVQRIYESPVIDYSALPIAPHVLKPDQIAPIWLVIFLLTCLSFVVVAIIWAAVHYH